MVKKKWFSSWVLMNWKYLQIFNILFYFIFNKSNSFITVPTLMALFCVTFVFICEVIELCFQFSKPIWRKIGWGARKIWQKLKITIQQFGRFLLLVEKETWKRVDLSPGGSSVNFMPRRKKVILKGSKFQKFQFLRGKFSICFNSKAEPVGDILQIWDNT